ncbi:MAG: transglycosylase SLT domain-containing protein [Minisyncoccales bacterium]
MCKLKGIVVWLPTIISLIGLLGGMYVAGKMVLAEAKVEASPTTLRELTLNEQQRLYLYEQVNYNIQDYQILSRIIWCESRWDAEAYNSKTGDVGLFQISEKYHLKNATELGYDIYNPFGNIDYGIYLYKKYGLQPWEWSKKCWER